MNREGRSRLRQRLLEKFTKRADQKDVKKIDKKLGSMQRGPITKIWDKVQLLWQFALDPNVPWEKKAVAIGALVYLISPLDAVPDLIPWGGLLDDVVVILQVARMLADFLKQYTVDFVREVTEEKSKVKIKTHFKKVLITVIGAIIIAGLALILRLL